MCVCVCVCVYVCVCVLYIYTYTQTHISVCVCRSHFLSLFLSHSLSLFLSLSKLHEARAQTVFLQNQGTCNNLCDFVTSAGLIRLFCCGVFSMQTGPKGLPAFFLLMLRNWEKQPFKSRIFLAHADLDAHRALDMIKCLAAAHTCMLFSR
jgi:hypothetical protein